MLLTCFVRTLVHKTTPQQRRPAVQFQSRNLNFNQVGQIAEVINYWFVLAGMFVLIPGILLVGIILFVPPIMPLSPFMLALADGVSVESVGLF